MVLKFMELTTNWELKFSMVLKLNLSTMENLSSQLVVHPNIFQKQW